MSYYLADANGYRDDFASIGGLAEFREWAPKSGPVAQFLDDGYTKHPQLLSAMLEHVPAPSDPNVASMREALITHAREADSVLILSDGC